MQHSWSLFHYTGLWGSCCSCPAVDIYLVGLRGMMGFQSKSFTFSVIWNSRLWFSYFSFFLFFFSRDWLAQLFLVLLHFLDAKQNGNGKKSLSPPPLNFSLIQLAFPLDLNSLHLCLLPSCSASFLGAYCAGCLLCPVGYLWYCCVNVLQLSAVFTATFSSSGCNQPEVSGVSVVSQSACR